MRQRSVLPILGPIVAVILVSSSWVGAQQLSSPGAQQQQPLKVQVSLVRLYATVRDKHNKIVSNLPEGDFKVFEDGQEQKIAYFSREMNLPLTLAMLIDTSGSQQNILGVEQEEGKAFLSQILTPKDLALVISFDTDVDLLADLTSDRSALDHALDGTRINAPANPSMIAQGPFPSSNRITGTDFYDAVYLAATDKLSGEAGRKAVIALTDAQDYGSQKTMQQAIDAAQRSDTVIHILLTVDRGFYGWGQYNGYGVAEQMTRQTGGRLIRVSNGKDLRKAFDELAQELRSQYVIGYYPTNAARDGSFRKVKIEVSGPEKLKVLTRDGYYAPSS